MKALHIVAGPPLYTNTFLLIGENGLAAAIDPAADAQRYEELLDEHGARLTHILLTHGHYDHVAAVEALREATGACVVMSEADARGGRLFPFVSPDRDYSDDETIPVDSDLSFRVICTPGHSAGSSDARTWNAARAIPCATALPNCSPPSPATRRSCPATGISLPSHGSAHRTPICRNLLNSRGSLFFIFFPRLRQGETGRVRSAKAISLYSLLGRQGNPRKYRTLPEKQQDVLPPAAQNGKKGFSR